MKLKAIFTINSNLMKNKAVLLISMLIIVFNGVSQNDKNKIKKTNTMANTIVKTNEEWKKLLSPEQYNVLREKGTEMPFSGKYYLHKEKGLYGCSACGEVLFKSDTKFDAGCGWPSFSDVLDSSKVNYIKDKTHGMLRTEITCARCNGHLGHVFEDGPAPNGLRYCINSVSIEFKK